MFKSEAPYERVSRVPVPGAGENKNKKEDRAEIDQERGPQVEAWMGYEHPRQEESRTVSFLWFAPPSSEQHRDAALCTAPPLGNLLLTYLVPIRLCYPPAEARPPTSGGFSITQQAY